MSFGIAHSQINKPTVVPETPPKPQANLDRKVPQLSHPIRLADFPGMQPRMDIKDQLSEFDDFVQNAPRDGDAATEKTTVWMGYTPTALYVVFSCYDHNASAIRGHLARRENILQDDYVSVLVDPFQDHRRGILFSLNPANVQADAIWTDGNGADYSYDQVWDSDTRLTPQGWMALFVIPFRSLRFRPAVSGNSAEGWGVVFTRNLPRNSETDNWPHISTTITGTLSQEGTLLGIQGVTGSHNVQINPYVLGQNEKTLQSLNPMNPYFSDRHLEGTAGGEAKAILHDSIVFDVTVNPDFSDVESEQPQFTVNQRYPVYFPELRPFFLENSNYFSTPINLVYTKNVIQPDYGARVTGKVGHTNLGFFLVDDREPGQTVPVGDPLYGKRATFAVGRVSQDIGAKGSTIGLMYTDEEFGGGWNRIGGADFTARFNDHWTVNGQMVESSTMQSDPNSAASVFPSGYSAGPASDLQVQRNGHAFNMYNEYQDISTSFQTNVGFLQTSDIRSDQYHATYRWYPKHSILQSYGLETNQNIAFDHQGNRVYHYTQLDPFFLLPGNVVLAPIVGQNSDTLGPQDGTLFTANHNFTENYGGFVARGAPLTQLNFNLVGQRSGNVNYNPVAGGLPFLLNQDFLQALITFQPIRPLTMDNTYLLDRDFATHGNQFVYENQVLRTKINYQFTTAFSARVIVEYDSLLANPLETSLLRTKQVQTQALFTWLPHPGTAIYVGYNNNIQNMGRSLCNILAGGGCDPTNLTPPVSPNYLNTGKQIFVKASYLLRF